MGASQYAYEGLKRYSFQKNDLAEEPGNFRSITVTPIIVRLFHKVLAARLQAAVPLDMKQRAFVPVDGCAENVHLLAELILEARHKHHRCTWTLNIAKAFDKVTTEAIIQALSIKSIDETVTKCIRDIYETAETGLFLQGTTRRVYPKRGVGQGGPLSPVLFMVLDGWLAHCPEDIGIKSGALTVNAIGFADHMIVVAANPQGLTEQLDDLLAFLQPRCLEINPGKSFTVPYVADAKRKITKITADQAFVIGCSTIPPKQAEETSKFHFRDPFCSSVSNRWPSGHECGLAFIIGVATL